MLSCKLFARLMSASSLVLFGLASSAMADTAPVDPHALFATGGDATDIGNGQAFQLSAPGGGDQGGGIFVYHNDTGKALSAVDVDITLPNSFLNGFDLVETVSANGGATSNGEIILTHACSDPTVTTSFCVEMFFSVTPGPLVPIDGNFVLDFDKPTSDGPPPVYGGVDEDVVNHTYNGGTDTSADRIGEWADGAMGTVTPVFVTPEPRQYAGLLAGIFALAVFLKRKRYAVGV